MFKAACGQAAAGIALIEKCGRIIYANQYLCDLLGISQEDLFAQPFGGQIHAEDMAARDDALRQLFDGSLQEYTAERRYIRKSDGHCLWLRIAVSLAKAASNAPDFLVAVVQDISDRKLNELALSKRVDRQQQLVTLSASLPGALCSYRSLPDGRTTTEFVTQAFREVVGYSPSEPQDVPGTQFRNVHPDDVPNLLNSITTAARERRPWRTEYRVFHPEKGWIYVEETSAPEAELDGSIVWYSFVHDVTARRIVEQQLSEQQSLCASVLATAMDAVVAVDQDLNIAVFNKAAEIMFGHAAENVIGQPYTLLAPRAQTRSNLKQFALIGSASRIDYAPARSARLVGLRSNGQEFPVEVSMSRTEARKNSILTAILRDVTERDRDEAHLRQAAAVFDNSQEAIVITDGAGSIIRVNPSFRRISGFEDSKVLGRTLTLLRSGRNEIHLYRQIAEKVAATGTWQGEAWIRSRNGSHTPHWVVVSTVHNVGDKPANHVVSFVDISRIKHTEIQLNHLALHDTLTGLPNRHLLNQRLARAIERSRQTERLGAVLFIDLDRFKTVNDSLGHQAGDELLRSIATRLKLRVRGGDTVSRLGGDEFVIVLEDIDDPGNACKVAQDIIEIIEEPVAVSCGHEVYVSASVGISFFPTDAETAEDLIQRADSALYAAKQSGRSVHRCYDVALTIAANERLKTESRMRRALVRNEFLLHYQPIIDLQRKRVVGAEALIRWNDPLHGFIQPLSFIPLAEETGFIVPLGDWVIRQACSQFNTWRQAGIDLDILSINVSARQFRLSDLPQRIEAVLREMDFPASCIEIEITESALMEEGTEAIKKLDALKKIGVHLSIDDFGTGYSSLSCLKRFPLDTLKVDRSFIRDVPTDTTATQITQAIILLAKTLNLHAIAEGVETLEQADFLKAEGCQLAQGYYFSQPLAPEDFVTWLSHWPQALLCKAA